MNCSPRGFSTAALFFFSSSISFSFLSVHSQNHSLPSRANSSIDKMQHQHSGNPSLSRVATSTQRTTLQELYNLVNRLPSLHGDEDLLREDIIEGVRKIKKKEWEVLYEIPVPTHDDSGILHGYSYSEELRDKVKETIRSGTLAVSFFFFATFLVLSLVQQLIVMSHIGTPESS